MTEYDYSPAAQQAYQDKLRSIDNWTNKVPAHHQLANPFLPSESGKTDFFASQRRSRSKKGSSRRGRRRERRAYDSDGEDSDYGSDYSGPNRPPTPPASAPVYGGFGQPAQPALYVSPYGTAVSPQGYGGGGYYQPTTAPASNLYVPMWVGGRVIYQPVPQQPQPASASLVPSSGHPDYDSRPRRHRSRSRPRAHRRNSHSVPAFPSPPQSPYNSPSYAYGYATGYLYPSWSQQMGNGMSANTSPQSMYSAPLPAGPGGAPGPTPYVTSPPLATAGTGPAPGYFGPQPHSAGGNNVYGAPSQVMVPQVVSPGGMSTSPYQVTVQSPNGSASVYSGHSSYVGGYPSVVIVGDAPRKSRSGGSSRKSWFGKFTGGM